MNNIYLYILIIVIIVLLLSISILLIKNRVSINKENICTKIDTNCQEIPKIIWTYWNDENIPEIINSFMNTWRIHNPDWNIIILNDKLVTTYLPDEDLNKYTFIDSLARRSDVIRCLILAKYGGVWSDASIIMYRSLNELLDIQKQNNYQFIGYYINGFTTDINYPIIESWFFACIPGSTFMKMWKDTFLTLNNYNSVDDWVNYMKNKINVQNMSMLNYLAIHVAAQYVLQKYMTIDEIKNTMYLMKAEDGPFKYLYDNDWNNYEGVKSLCNNDYKNITLISKLRGVERNVLDNNKELEYCILNKNIIN